MMVSFGMTDASINMQPFEKIENLKKEMQMDDVNPVPEYLYKIASLEEWQESLRQKQVALSPLDKDFIHLATKEQVAHVLQKFWSNKSYKILKLDSRKLIGRLVYETNPGGTTQYYHLYQGKIPLDAVIDSSTSFLT